MDVILPYDTDNREHFCTCALQCGFHEFVALKMLYTMKDSDMDVFPIMARERLDLVLYGWELCQVHWDELKAKEEQPAIPAYLLTVLKQITQYSLDVWFSNEWKECKPKYKAMLIICLKRAIELLMQLADATVFDWGYTLRLGTKPWDIPYLKEFVTKNCKLAKKYTKSSEHVEVPATPEDIEHLKKEGLLLMLLRLIKLFDAGFVEGVRRLSMRVIAAWNHEYEQCKQLTKISFPEVNTQHKQCLILICHIYLMSIYEMDDIRGFVIDNMLTNIRFYNQNMSDEANVKTNPAEELEYTPARYIAITCVNLQISASEFIDAFIYDSYDECFVSLFGVVSQSYLSYLLGNLLMEMNKLNEDDFSKCAEDFKRIIHLYIKERERSEVFMLREMHKKELKRRSHTVSKTMENMTNFYNKMCKGNRLSNVGSTEHTEEDVEKKTVTEEEENERRVDPVFQHLPNNENVLNYVYTVLVKRTHRGWYFAKLIVLLKIINLQLNAIETWRYHPGLTTDFLLSLEVKLSRHFEDLANIFQEHLFMEQEFWLTGFYLNPCKKYYETVIRSGMRSNRLSHRFETGAENYGEDDDKVDNKRDRRAGDRGGGGGDRPERANAINAKYGLLSSTIDVKEIVQLANHEAPDVDYGQLYKALRSFKLPDNTIKDLLTVIFLPRNKSFAWALNWVELRKRCKNLLRDNEQKRHFVELNMAEANDRLTFLKVDYDKYKHRPQLDYGTIEQGYESTNLHNFNKDSSDENDDEDSEDFEADSDLDEPAKNEPKKSDHSKLFDSFFMSTRRTRARAAAMIANVMESEMKDDSGEEDIQKAIEVSKDSKQDEKCAKTEDVASTSTKDRKRDIKDILRERKVFDNSTSGFNPFPDIWSVKDEDLKIVEDKVPHLETGKLFAKSSKLEMLKLKTAKLLNQQNLKYKIAQEVIMQDTEIEVAEEEEKQKDVEVDYIDAPKVTDSQPLETDKARHDSTADIEMPDDESDVSTAARRDSDEVNDMSKDEQLDDADELLQERFSVAVTESPKKSTKNAERNILDVTHIKVEVNESDKGNETNENKTEKETERNEKEIAVPTEEIEKETELKEKDSEKSDNAKDIETESKKNETEKTQANEIETDSMEIQKQTEGNESEKEEETKELEKETKEIRSKTKENEKEAESIQTELETKSKEKEKESNSKDNEKVTESVANNMEAETDKPEITNNENKTEITASETNDNKSTISEYDELLKRFKRRKLRVRVRRLRVEDVHKLRQPSVRLQRMDLQAVGSRVGTLRRAERKFYNDSDDSSKSSFGSSSTDRPLHDTLKRSIYSSESSTESEEFKKRRRVGRPSRARSMQSNTATAAQSSRDNEPAKSSSSASLKMTPRSASGLKFRISANEKAKRGNGSRSSTSFTRTAASSVKTKVPPIIDYIQISSSSSSDEELTFVRRNVVQDDDVMDITIDPLFEEEIPLFRIAK